MFRVLHRLQWVRRPQAILGLASVVLVVLALLSPTSLVWPQTTSSPHHYGRHAQLQSSQLPDCHAKPCLALTFDDGPNATVTPRVLDVLKQHNVRATFFVIGIHVQGNEALLRRIHAEGHEIGNHTWNHPDLTTLSPADVQSQIQMTQNIVGRAGVPLPQLLRPPYGSVNDMVKSQAHMTIVRWNIDPDDWQVLDSQKVYDNVMATAKPGGVVLMHDIYPSTADALGPVIDSLQQKYQLVTASQLLQIEAGAQGQYFAH